MGNPNARPKKELVRKDSDYSVNTGPSGSPGSTKSVMGGKSVGSGALLEDKDSPINSHLTEKALATLNNVSPTHLRFKSYKTGTLITNNGVPADQGIAPFPPPAVKHTPLFSPTRSANPSSSFLKPKLDANTPAFVPRIRQQMAPATNARLPSPNTPALQQVQNLLQELRIPAGPVPRNGPHTRHQNGGMDTVTHNTHMQGYHQSAGANHPYDSGAVASSRVLLSPAHSSTAGAHTGRAYSGGGINNNTQFTHRQSALQTVRPPKTYYERINKSKKDIVISASGVERNAVKVIESYLPDGTPIPKRVHEFNGPYDFIADYHSMTAKEKSDLLLVKQVEIVVEIKQHDEVEKHKDGVKGNGRNKRKGKGKKVENPEAVGAMGPQNGQNCQNVQNGEMSNAPITNGNGREKAQPSMNEEPTQVATVIDTLNALGPEFAPNVKNLMVTLDFSAIPLPAAPLALEQGQPGQIPTGPRIPAVAPFSADGPLAIGPNFHFLTSLVRTMQSFTGLTNMTINLRVVSGHNQSRITIPQLTLVLPFYDLLFTDWTIAYQTEFLTTVVPIQEREYPIKWLDRERNKIIYQREKQIEHAVFVRRSSVGGKVANWNKQKY